MHVCICVCACILCIVWMCTCVYVYVYMCIDYQCAIGGINSFIAGSSLFKLSALGTNIILCNPAAFVLGYYSTAGSLSNDHTPPYMVIYHLLR